MRYYFIFGLLLFSFLLMAQPAIGLELIANGFNRPVDLTHAGDERVFVVEQDGVIKIIENGNVLATPFLDIDAQVRSIGNEQGLLGLAFHPDYANNGWFFVNYINNNGDTRVSRFSVSANNPNIADSDSELPILSVIQPYSNHNGGCMKFGPDGYLYIGLGDGGSGGDPDGYGQNRLEMLGKMLRIDVNASTEAVPYAIPTGNPFAADDFTLDEIWAIGLRNPWRFSFDKQTGDLWIGDVGQGDWEEIDFQDAESSGGENYGWRCYEGDHTFNTFQCGDMNDYDFPVFEYPNSFSGGCSVTGGYVHRGTEFTELNGYYLFSDYCLGVINTLFPDGSGGWLNEEVLNTGSFVSSFGEDLAGELYVLDLFAGTVSKVVEGCTVFSVSSVIENESCAGQSDGSITLTISDDSSVLWSTGSSDNPLTELGAAQYSATITNTAGCETVVMLDVESDFPAIVSPIILEETNTLSVADDYDSYQWFFNGSAVSGAISSTYIAMETGVYFVVVTNEAGCSVFSNILPFQLVNTFDALGINEFLLSPNPFKDNFQLKISTSSTGIYNFTILAATGSEVHHFQQNIVGTFQQQIEMKDLATGLYFMVIEHNGHRFIRRLVKAK